MTCVYCDGTGKEKCIRCDGTGTILTMVGGPFGTTSLVEACPVCDKDHMMTCRVCGGKGIMPIHQPGEVCAKCNGSGKIMCSSYLCNGTGHYMGPYGVIICSMCFGSGRMKCDNCHGTGRY
jgi:hypothetical protein